MNHQRRMDPLHRLADRRAVGQIEGVDVHPNGVRADHAAKLAAQLPRRPSHEDSPHPIFPHPFVGGPG